MLGLENLDNTSLILLIWGVLLALISIFVQMEVGMVIGKFIGDRLSKTACMVISILTLLTGILTVTGIFILDYSSKKEDVIQM